MPLLPLYGHHPLRDRVRDAVARGALPASMLLHGPRGVGKQRLALWIGQLLVCEGSGQRPCGECLHCRYALSGGHPDLHWYFPRPRLKDTDSSPEEIRADIAEAVAERIAGGGLYSPTSGSEAIFVATVRAIVHSAMLSPAMAKRKVFVIGEADRMVAQEGSDQAANAFLKLLEEPSANTTIILTSSEPGALLPTVRSRVVAFRVPPLPDRDVLAFLGDLAVRDRVRAELGGVAPQRMTELAAGAPGRLFAHADWEKALAAAQAIVVAAESGDRGKRARAALVQGASGARGAFSDILDALTAVLHEKTRDAVRRSDPAAARAAARGMDSVERAKELAAQNVNPQLITAGIINDLAGARP